MNKTKKVLSFILALQMLINITGCVSSKKSKDTSINNKKIEIMANNLEDREKVNYVNVLKYINEITEIETTYDYSEYYFDGSEFEEIKQVAESTTSCDKQILFMSAEEIYSTIQKNSNKFEKSPFKDKNIIIISEIHNALYKALVKCIQTNNGDDICKLQDVSIVLGTLEEEVLATYDNSQELITLDYKNIKNSYKELFREDMPTFEQYLSEIIEHELHHARQYICDCRKEKGQINSKLAYHGLESIIEASAESQIYYNNWSSVLDTYDFSYYKERKIQAFLLLMGMFKDDFSLETYYNSIFNSDLKNFYKLYNLESSDDFRNFYNIIYAMETKLGDTELSEHLNDTYGSFYNKIDNDYKIDIFKVVVSDLMKKIQEDNLSYEESLKLYVYVKANIIYNEDEIHKIEEDYIYLYSEDFLKGIGEVEDIFYEFITARYNKSKELIKIYTSNYQFTQGVDYLLHWHEISKMDYISEEIKLENAYLIEKYPIIKEISFNINGYSYMCDNFNEARENNYTKERILIN